MVAEPLIGSEAVVFRSQELGCTYGHMLNHLKLSGLFSYLYTLECYSQQRSDI